MGAKRMRTSRQQLIEEPATLADRTANGAGADAEPARKLASEGERHIKLLAEALGKCLVAAGIVRSDAALTGPELLMFAEDLERALSSPDHADAGKLVEGDGWLPIESAPKDKMLLLACANWAPVEKLGREVPIKVGYRSFGRWTVFGASWTPTHWRPLPSAPSQEVAG